MVGYLLPIFKDNFDQGPLDKSIFIIQQLFDVVLTEPDLRKIQFLNYLKNLKDDVGAVSFLKPVLDPN